MVADDLEVLDLGVDHLPLLGLGIVYDLRQQGLFELAAALHGLLASVWIGVGDQRVLIGDGPEILSDADFVLRDPRDVRRQFAVSRSNVGQLRICPLPLVLRHVAEDEAPAGV